MSRLFERAIADALILSCILHFSATVSCFQLQVHDTPIFLMSSSIIFVCGDLYLVIWEAALVQLASVLGKELADQGSNPGSSHLFRWGI